MKNLNLVWIVLIITLVLPLSPTTAQDDYTVTVVGGQDEPQTYPDQEVEGFQFTDQAYRSLYPYGLEFKATIVPPAGVSYSSVTLFYAFTNSGKTGRINAEPGEQENEWIAVPYNAAGLPPWHEIDAYWGVRGTDISIESAPIHAVYYDPTREWYRTENQYVIVYWYGMPEELGKHVLDAQNLRHQMYIDGFGEEIPYRPVSVIFPPGKDWNEYQGDTEIDDTSFGFTGTIIPEAGGTIQRVRSLEPAEIRAECIWNPENPDVEFQMKQAASTTTHEIAHLYQQEVGVSGPLWWVEGQATFFETFDEYDFHARLRKLAELRGGDFPSFQGDGPGGGALTASEDGCTHLIYDMGASFMRWLVEAHGGIDTYRGIVENMSHGITLEQSLENVTGLTFLDLENEWRAFLGVGPVPAELLDPSLALDAPIEPFFAEGEEVTLPGTPFQQPVYNAPSTTAIADGTCFANSAVTILLAGSDGVQNWYQVDCMGMQGWMSQEQLGAAQ